MAMLLIGIAVSLNIIFILYKFESNRYIDGTLDTLLLILVTVVFMGSYEGLVVGTIASLIVSIYLYYKPPKLPSLAPASDQVSTPTQLTRSSINDGIGSFIKRVNNAR